MEILVKEFGVLLVLMVVNIISGTALANINEVFNKDVLKKGIWKAVCLAVCFGGIALCGYVCPELVIGEYNIIDVLPMVLLAGLGVYAGKVAKNMAALIGLETSSLIEVREDRGEE